MISQKLLTPALLYSIPSKTLQLTDTIGAYDFITFRLFYMSLCNFLDLGGLIDTGSCPSEVDYLYLLSIFL